MPNKLQVVRSIAELRGVVAQWRNNGHRIGLVPTMGALHSGHLGLVRRAAQLADRTLVSIFVNPSQFAPHEDLARYPRDEAGDLAKFATEECHLVWAPTAVEMYPEGFATRIAPAGAAQGLESDFRPHFFGGVATVCCKLFTQMAPDIAVFGEKDYQQLAVVRQMVRDLDLPLEIVGLPTVREADGLAMSSRNAYLSPDQRRTAPTIYAVITAVAEAARQGAAIDKAVAEGKKALESAGFKVDYLEVRDAETLKAAEPGARGPLRVLAAAWLGKTRLIDNIAIEQHSA